MVPCHMSSKLHSMLKVILSIKTSFFSKSDISPFKNQVFWYIFKLYSCFIHIHYEIWFSFFVKNRIEYNLIEQAEQVIWFSKLKLIKIVFNVFDSKKKLIFVVHSFFQTGIYVLMPMFSIEMRQACHII